MNNALQATTPNAIDNLFERSILDIGIPPCPAILDRFMAEIRQDDPHYNRLAGIICTDVAISASLIKTANSPFFGMRQRVRSVNEALTILGLNASSRAVAGIVLRNAFPHVLNMERFWDASARIARTSGWLAQYLNVSDLHPNDAYTYALFRDCGIPVLLGHFPDYKKVLMKANHNEKLSFTDVEETALPTNHAVVGCLLAQSWWLPEEICLAIRHHHDLISIQSVDTRLPILSRRMIAVSQLAEHLVQKQLELSLTQEWLKLGQTCLQLLEISENQLDLLYLEAPSVIASLD